ncbi:MAG: IclR family transcriptional regulator [Deltaproteobacteria bacterium]|nr:IclR family transcriptional regulator [Deltaproteobacteria bacterium]
MGERYQAPSVKKAFQILRLVADSAQGVGISELARGLGISKGTVHGITAALEDLGAIKRDSRTKRYSLGLTLFELGRLAYAQVDLKDLARPILEELMEKTQESVFLGVLNGDHVTILDIVESRHDLKITSPIGTILPIFAGSTGKVFLAAIKDLYMEEIRRVRQEGHAIDDGEYIMGVRAVTCPIKTDHHLISAIWVVGFNASMDDDKMRVIVEETKGAAAEIGNRIQGQYAGG